MALKAHPGKVTKAYEDTKKGKKTWEVKIDGADGKSGRCITRSRPGNWSPMKTGNVRPEPSTGLPVTGGEIPKRRTPHECSQYRRSDPLGPAGPPVPLDAGGGVLRRILHAGRTVRGAAGLDGRRVAANRPRLGQLHHRRPVAIPPALGFRGSAPRPIRGFRARAGCHVRLRQGSADAARAAPSGA
jgi:hypothetical protein